MMEGPASKGHGRRADGLRGIGKRTIYNNQ